MLLLFYNSSSFIQIIYFSAFLLWFPFDSISFWNYLKIHLFSASSINFINSSSKDLHKSCKLFYCNLSWSIPHCMICFCLLFWSFFSDLRSFKYMSSFMSSFNRFNKTIFHNNCARLESLLFHVINDKFSRNK